MGVPGGNLEIDLAKQLSENSKIYKRKLRSREAYRIGTMRARCTGHNEVQSLKASDLSDNSERVTSHVEGRRLRVS